MPGIQELERFKNSFRAIGDEEAALARRGEAIEDIPLPENKIDEDLASLLDSGEPSSDADKSADDAGTDAGGDFDFSAFLDSIPDNVNESPQAPETAVPADDTDFSVPNDLLSGFADEMEAAAEEEPPKETEAEEPDGATGTEDDFNFGDIDFGDSEVAEKEAGSAVQETENFDISDFSEPDATEETAEPDFELPGFEEPETAENAAAQKPDVPEELEESLSLFTEEAPELTTEEMTEAPAQAEEDSGFSIPDFNLEDQTAPAAAASGAEAPEAAAGDDGDFGFETGGAEAAANAPLDSFDTFSLDDNFLSSGFGVNDEKEESQKSDESFATLEDFSLEGIDDVFKSQGPAAGPASGAPERRRAPIAAGAEVEEINLSDTDFKKLQNTLAGYPLNLRIACEELIAEHAVPPDQMSALVKMLVKGATTKDMASAAGRLIGRAIIIPRGFEKSSGAALEAEKGTFGYMFVHTILPVLRIFIFAGLVAASLAYLGIEFVYKPMRANSLYDQGHKRVLEGEYARGNERFDEAGRVWRIKKWYFKYAESFIEKRQYILAEQKYDQLLANYPHDKQGALDYAGFESRVLRNYEKAERILRHEIIDYKLEDKEGLLALGDNNLEWGELDPARYEEARKAYARLMGAYGKQDEYLERMLLYFIRTDNLAETLPLQEYFLASKKAKISAAALAELGGYYLDKKTAVVEGVPDQNLSRIENIKKLLQEATRRDPKNAEANYHMARYYERYNRPAEERKAAEMAIAAFAAAPELSTRRMAYRIEAHRKLASVLVKEKEFITAEEKLVEGIRLFEDALGRKMLKKGPQFGRLYAELGDIEYFKAGDFDSAVRNYLEAEAQGYSPPELHYRLGYAAYARSDWAAAVEYFSKTGAELSLNRRILFSLGNSLYRRGDLHSAQGYYKRLLDMLETERARFPTLLPNERPDHAELAERLMRARNNLGVTLEDLAERTGDSRYRSRALALYSESARAWDSLTRDPKSMVRSESTNLAFLNTRGSLHPERRFEAQIYAEIDKDGLEPSSWEEILAK